MGFLVGILRKLGSSSIVSNMGPKLNLGTKMHCSFGTLTMEDIKQDGTLEQKRACLKELLHEMVWRMRRGIQGGCTDLEQIPVIYDGAYLPDETYVVGKYPSYLFSVKDLAVHLHENDQMSSRDSMKFEDFKIYTSLLSNIRHLVLLARHPHLQTTVQEIAYIPATFHQMDLIPAKPNALYPYRHFPLPHPNCHQVPRALAFTSPEKHLHQWQDAYRRVCVNRRVHIARSIASAGIEFHDVYNYRSSFKTTGYNDHDPIDELRYYSNVIKHHKNLDKAVDSLYDMFPSNTTEMFKFHWCYDMHAMGAINLEHIQQQDYPWV